MPKEPVLTEENLHDQILYDLGQRIRDLKKIPVVRLVEYIAESNHQGWDGWSDTELVAFKTLAEDMIRFDQHYE
jgi:hypothetical protein